MVSRIVSMRFEMIASQGLMCDTLSDLSGVIAGLVLANCHPVLEV